MVEAVTHEHHEVETLKVDVIIPEHAARTTTALFRHSREELQAREQGRCWVCGRTKDHAGPLEAHHHPIERSMAEMIDWQRLAADCKAGLWGPHAQAFDWDGFFADAAEVEHPAWTDSAGHAHPAFKTLHPVDIYRFVDDMRVNGLLLCKEHHTVGGEGIHTLPYPLFVPQRYGISGYHYTAKEVIEHESD